MPNIPLFLYELPSFHVHNWKEKRRLEKIDIVNDFFQAYGVVSGKIRDPYLFFSVTTPMLSFFAIVYIVKIILLVTTLILGLLYISLTVVIQGLRTSLNVLMINVCVACIIRTCFWIVYNLLKMTNSPLMRYDDLCWFYSYAQNVSVCQVVYGFCAVSLNRYLIVVYSNNIYFKRRQWALICVLTQWFIGVLLPTPLWSSKVRTINRYRKNLSHTLSDMWSIRHSMGISTVQSICRRHHSYCFHYRTQWYPVHVYSQINNTHSTNR